ncbi:hypothetical protein MML48_2g00007365 [Holotrichia oblita]|uniref:Uncharacterized protein n=1 Tax=Holotrichia oblita TaxID=644536 RepID=A0ACB9TIY7_HOLOL|nr:hypothetical protein MML48_2g00007365 [Holotrichia oblita]
MTVMRVYRVWTEEAKGTQRRPADQPRRTTERIGLAVERTVGVTSVYSRQRPGFFPLNRTGFCDDDFAPASVIDRDYLKHISTFRAISSDLNPRACSSDTQNGSIPQPLDLEDQLTNTLQTNMNRIAGMTPVEVQPLPKALSRTQTKRKAETTKILTDTPVKATLRSKTVTPKVNQWKNKKPALFDSSDEDTEDPSYQDESDVEGKTLQLLSSSDDDDEDIPPPKIESIGERTYVLVTFIGRKICSLLPWLYYQKTFRGRV